MTRSDSSTIRLFPAGRFERFRLLRSSRTFPGRIWQLGHFDDPREMIVDCRQVGLAQF